jgi:hypothetical protein
MLATISTKFPKYLLLILCSDIITYVSERKRECCANKTFPMVAKLTETQQLFDTQSLNHAV